MVLIITRINSLEEGGGGERKTQQESKRVYK